MDNNEALRIGEAILEEYSLQYGNAEAVVQDGTLLLEVEGPNHSTTQASVDITADTTIKDIITAVQDALFEFNVDNEFTELWSREFSKHNGLTPSRFIDNLRDDANFFKSTEPHMKVEDIEKWLRNNPDTEGGD